MTRAEIERLRALHCTATFYDERLIALCDAALAMLPVVEAAEKWDRMLDEVAAGRPWNREQSQRLRNAVAAYRSSPHRVGKGEGE